MRIDLLFFTFTIFLFALFYNKFLFSDISKYLNYKTYILFSVLIFIFYKFFIFNETIFYQNILKLIILLSFLFISSKFFEKKNFDYILKIFFLILFLNSLIILLIKFSYLTKFSLISNLDFGVYHQDTYQRLSRAHSLNYGGSSLSLIYCYFFFLLVFCKQFKIINLNFYLFMFYSTSYVISAYLTGRLGFTILILVLPVYILFFFDYKKFINIKGIINYFYFFLFFFIFFILNPIFWVENEVFQLISSPSLKELLLNFDEFKDEDFTIINLFFGNNYFYKIDGGYTYMISAFGIVISVINFIILPIYFFNKIKNLEIYKLSFVVFLIFYISNFKLPYFIGDFKLLLFFLFLLCCINFIDKDKFFLNQKKYSK